MTAEVANLLAAVRANFPAGPPKRLGIAVSGGSDSLALLHLLAEAFADDDTQLLVATVDHGLRDGSADEARHVAQCCAALGLSHETLNWADGPCAGNLQANARRARYALLAEWALRNDLVDLAVGHTADDQAETVVMRMARASGVQGLSGMAVRRTEEGITLIRPMLGLRRAVLREYLTARGVSWCEDPGNQNPRFERIRARRALKELEPLGISAEVLGRIAQLQRKANEAINWYSFLEARQLVQLRAGAFNMDRKRLRALPDEIARRLLNETLSWIGGQIYPPRAAASMDLLHAARSGRGLTLSGCQLLHRGRLLWICRELKAVDTEHCPTEALWDGRWMLTGPAAPDLSFRALGPEGLRGLKHWRDSGLPGAVLQVTPGVWRGDTLIAAPLAGWAQGWQAQLEENEEAYFARLLSH